VYKGKKTGKSKMSCYARLAALYTRKSGAVLIYISQYSRGIHFISKLAQSLLK